MSYCTCVEPEVERDVESGPAVLSVSNQGPSAGGAANLERVSPVQNPTVRNGEASNAVDLHPVLVDDVRRDGA